MRLSITLLLASRESRRLFRSPGLFLLLGGTWAIAGMVLRSYREFVFHNSLVVLSQPLSVPVATTALGAALYLSFAAATAICRERETGTLEVLFYAPIRMAELIAGHFLAYAAAGGLVVLASSTVFVGAAGWLGFQPGASFWGGIPVAVLAVAEAGALGLFISASTQRVRSAVLLTLGLFAIFLGVYLGAEALAAVSQPGSWADFGQEVMDWSVRAVQAVSPLELFRQGSRAIGAGQLAVYAGILGLGLLRTAIWLAAAVWWSGRLGVRA